jgi:hypothetical protein
LAVHIKNHVAVVDKKEVMQGQWFGPSNGLPGGFWRELWPISLPKFSQTTSQISTPNDSDGIQMGISSIKQCLLGPRMKNEVMQGQWFGP